MAASGREAEALPLFEEALSVQREFLPAGHPDLTDTLTGLGSLHCARGAADVGLPLLRQARNGLAEASSADRRRIAAAETALARCS
jgi:hypothetical protein